MLRGLYTASVGMTTQMQRMDVVSNNIANVNTTGYKRDISVTSSFDDLLAKRVRDLKDVPFSPVTFSRNIGNMTYGAYVEEIFTDFGQGSIQSTQETLDLAINGGGFFTVNTPSGERYTRDGSFTIDAEGFLVTADGGRVQGQNGDIRLPDGVITIDESGNIYSGSDIVDSLRISDFEDYRTLRKQGDNYLSATNGTTSKPFEGRVFQGMLEMSNVNTVKEMIDLIAVNRIYEANSKVVSTMDQIMQKSAQDVGRK